MGKKKKKKCILFEAFEVRMQSNGWTFLCSSSCLGIVIDGDGDYGDDGSDGETAGKVNYDIRDI